jgi:PAS domain S-box-containing protein
MADFLGVGPEELIGKKCYELLHRSSEPFSGCPHLETIKTGFSASTEISDPCMGKPFLVTTSPIQDDQGKQVGVVHIAKDISERAEAERAIKESESQFRAIFKEAGIGMALVMNGHILEANPSFLRLLGYDENEIKGLTISDITHPDDREMDQTALQYLIASDKESYQLEKRYIRKNGEVVWGK